MGPADTPPPGDLRGGAEGTPVLECVANISEGRDLSVLGELAAACGGELVDLHHDAAHHRSVFTMAGAPGAVARAARSLASAAVSSLDLGAHSGAHPRFGVVDVVPFVALEGWPLRDARPPQAALARAERDSFARWAASTLGIPVFLYGPGRPLPEVRRRAWHDLLPDFGPARPHPSAGSVAVGARAVMVAYNLWLADPDMGLARRLARELRSPRVRSLAFALADQVQVSFNLVEPFVVGPAQVYDAVARQAPVAKAEVVGLVPLGVLQAVPRQRWTELGLLSQGTIEDRLGRPARSS